MKPKKNKINYKYEKLKCKKLKCKKHKYIHIERTKTKFLYFFSKYFCISTGKNCLARLCLALLVVEPLRKETNIL